jgi:hypothetical protein
LERGLTALFFNPSSAAQTKGIWIPGGLCIKIQEKCIFIHFVRFSQKDPLIFVHIYLLTNRPRSAIIINVRRARDTEGPGDPIPHLKEFTNS